jgi:hypothetical protein
MDLTHDYINMLEETFEPIYKMRVQHAFYDGFIFGASILLVGVFVIWLIFRTPTCGSFFFKNSAQKLYDQDPLKWKSLDGDQDGIACERYER